MKPYTQKLGTHRGRRVFAVLITLLIIATYQAFQSPPSPSTATIVAGDIVGSELARDALERLEIKGRAPYTNYSRSQFGTGWLVVDGCDMRNRILARDLEPETYATGGCRVLTGTLTDPYTGKTYQFVRGQGTSDDVQIDHVVALADAWQKGAQSLTKSKRTAFANDPLNLLAVDGPTNVQKSSSDAASWLPPNKSYRCRYVARQIAVKLKYYLWVTKAEYNAMNRVLSTCPQQLQPIVSVPK